MPGLLDLIDFHATPPRLAGTGLTAASLLDQLEAGDCPAALLERHRLRAPQLVAAVSLAGLGPDDDAGPPLTQRSPLRPSLVAALRPEALGTLFPRASRPCLLALAAGVYQVLDAWEASHTAAQEADDLGERAVSPYWHGIAHRREPDAWNAGYWFRRVGAHPLFPALASAARPLLDSHGDPALASRLLPGGSWDPLAFIDLCTTSRPGSPTAALARRIQRTEMSLLLEETLRPLLTH